MHERRFEGKEDKLRSKERMDLMEIDRIVDLIIGKYAPHTLLDVGVGTAIFAEAFSAKGLTVAGIDVNPDMIEISQALLPQSDFRVAPAEKIPQSDKSFDVVLLSHVLHEVDNYVQSLSEAGRVARQAVVVLEWPYIESSFGPPLSHRLSPQKVLTFAQQAGFQKIETHPLSHMNLFFLDF